MRSSRFILSHFMFVASMVSSACCAGRGSQDHSEVGVPSIPTTRPQAGALQTPGMIWCGGRQCDLKDSYCKNEGTVESTALRCAPKGPDFEPNQIGPYSMLCDDASDCGAGEVCCENDAGSGSVVYQCAKAPCGLREVCVEGSACRPGLTCQSAKHTPLGDTPTGAACAAAQKGAQCNKQRCSGQRPVCCWDPEASTGTCIGENEPCGTSHGRKVAYRCSSKADCGGYFCLARTPEGTFCAGLGVLFEGAVCMTKDDCPPQSCQTFQPYVGCKMDSVGSGKCVSEGE